MPVVFSGKGYALQFAPSEHLNLGAFSQFLAGEWRPHCVRGNNLDCACSANYITPVKKH